MSSEASFQLDSRPPPPAPPLPPQRYGQRAAHAIARLGGAFLYGSRPSTPQGHRESGSRSATGLRGEPGRQNSSSSLSSKNVSHKTGIHINALDVSPEGTHAVIAGRDILKTIRVDDDACAEDFNIRAKLNQYASAHASRDAVLVHHRDQFNVNDVKWSRKSCNTVIATAAMNGRIIVYDINRPSLEMARLHEHSRLIHKLAFNPWQGALLLSGSHDESIRLWDLRAVQGERTVRQFGSVKRFSGNADGVRDVRWSPSDVFQFATATDSGVIQKWDFRKENAPLLKLNAHEKACHSIDWHPHGKYLASAGADKLVKIWDFQSTDRRMKSLWQIKAPQSILHARWRRDWTIGEGVSSEIPFTSQIATSYVGRDSRIHVWDLNRPHVPFKEFDRGDSAANDILWHTPGRLWSVGSGGTFTQTNIDTVSRPIDQQNVNVITTGPDGRIAFFSDARLRRRTSLAEAEDGFLSRPDPEGSSGERFSGSQSANEGSLEETSNPTVSIQSRRQRFAESRQGTSNSREVAFHSSEERQQNQPTLQPTYQTTQIAASGSILGVLDTKPFEYFATNGRLPDYKKLLSHTSVLGTISEDFEHNAKVSAQTGQYRLAQTWRITSLIVRRALESRLDVSKQQHRKSSSGYGSKVTQAITIPTIPSIKIKNGLNSSEDMSSRQTLQTTGNDSTSNVATPLARPAQGLQPVPANYGSSLDNSRLRDENPNDLSKWDVHRPPTRPLPSPGDVDSEEASSWTQLSPRSQLAPAHDNETSPIVPYLENMAETDEQLERRRNALADYRGQPRSLIRLEEPKEGSYRAPIPMRVERHDSSESFQMFSQSAESDPRSLQLIGSFGESQRSEASDQASAYLGASIRQDITNSLLSRQTSAQYEQRRPSVQPQPSSQPVPVLDRKDSSGLESMTINAKVHDAVQRPSEKLPPIIHFRGGLDDPKEDPIISPNPDADSFLFNDSAEKLITHHIQPWKLSELLPHLIDYHLSVLNDVQFPAILALYLLPFFPALFDPTVRTTAFLRTYHARLTSLELFSEAAAFRLACSSAFPDLRNSLVYGAGKATFLCRKCEKPKKGDRRDICERCKQNGTQCGVCNQSHAPDPPELWPQPYQRANTAKPKRKLGRSSKLWFWCQGCGHGGHTSCLRAWWSASDQEAAGATQQQPDVRPPPTISRPVSPGTTTASAAVASLASPTTANTASAPSNSLRMPSSPPSSPVLGDLSGGACPVVGCGHDCMPGRVRGKWRAAKAREKGRGKDAVMRDEWVARESGAVLNVRGQVGSRAETLVGAARRVRLREPGSTGQEGGTGDGLGNT